MSCDVSYLDDEIEDISLNWNVKIPVGFINYSLSEIFEDLGSSDLEPTSTEEFSFKYTQNFVGENNNQFDVSINDTTIDGTLENPITQSDLDVIGETFPYTITSEIAPGVPNPLIGIYYESDQKAQDLNLSQELTGVEFNGGNLTITFDSTIDAEISIDISIPSFTKKSDNSTYQESITISRESNQTITINLNEYNADLTNDGTGTGKTINTIIVDVDAMFAFAAGDLLEANDNLTYQVLMSNATYDVIYGDFKQESFSVSSNTIDLEGFFDNFSEGDISFDNVYMAINITNDYGFPISIDLSSVSAISESSFLNLYYTGNPTLPNTIIIDGVDTFGDEAKTTSILLNDSNSNIASLLESKPSSIDFVMSGKANPIEDGNPNENFYASINSGFNAEIVIGFDEVTLSKKIEFNGAEDLSNFEYIKLLVNVENKAPLSGDILLEFKNSSGQVVHTEFVNAFQAANVDQSGQSDGVGVLTNFEIELNQSEINSITEATDINLRLSFQLPIGSDSVMIKGSDEINVTIAIEAATNITSEN